MAKDLGALLLMTLPCVCTRAREVREEGEASGIVHVRDAVGGGTGVSSGGFSGVRASQSAFRAGDGGGLPIQISAHGDQCGASAGIGQGKPQKPEATR